VTARRPGPGPAEVSDDSRLSVALKGIEQQLDAILAMNRLLLAVRLVQDGHAKDLREASRIVRDLDRVAEFYPEPPE
jgi:hypothetical protein